MECGAHLMDTRIVGISKASGCLGHAARNKGSDQHSRWRHLNTRGYAIAGSNRPDLTTYKLRVWFVMKELIKKRIALEGELLPPVEELVQSKEIVPEFIPKERGFLVENNKTGHSDIVKMVYFYSDDNDIRHGYNKKSPDAILE